MSVMIEPLNVYLEKAEESLVGAESEFTNRRYNNAASRCYYACFQAAIHALILAGIQPPRDQWGHDFVQAQFNGQLINRRKLYPSGLRIALVETWVWREVADYKMDRVPERRAAQVIRSAEQFVEAVRQGGQRT
jgi:uncharacterized protein (UPF0332 family)